MLRNMVHLPLCQQRKVNEISEKQVMASSYIRMNCLAPATCCEGVLCEQTVNMIPEILTAVLLKIHTFVW
jgi:hypothetical protein